MFGNKNDANNESQGFIKILGTGCRNCVLLEENVRVAIAECGLDTSIGHVRRIEEIVSYGVMSTPALVFGREVVSAGRVLSVQDVKQLIEKNRAVFE